MKKIKIIKAINIQGEIDKWVNDTNPIIHSTSLSSMVLQNGNAQNIISIVYEEKTSLPSNVGLSGPKI